MTRRIISGLVALAFVGIGCPLFAAGNAFSGTWKLNLAKSSAIQWSAGKLLKLSDITDDTNTVTVEGDKTTVRMSGTVSGQSGSAVFTVPTAGGPLTYTGAGGPPEGITETLKIVDDRTDDFIDTMNGKVVLTTHCVVSPNHKTMILTQSGVDEKGKPFKTRKVYDLQ
jgi:hypothetical protein